MAWFDDAFGPWYLKLYAHRDREEAAHTLRALDPWLPRGGRMLDVACGRGRHLEVLIERGQDAVGLDRSVALLTAAPAFLRPHLVRGDMRKLPFPDGAFRVLFSFFTSFGYFGSRPAHEALLAEFARAVAAGGRLVLDVPNLPQIHATLAPVSERAVAGHAVRELRTLLHREDEDVVIKEVEVSDPAGRRVASFREEVSLYERHVLLRMLGQAGWRETKTLGSYEAGAWTPASPRLILIAERMTA
jgi:SAM-dependent methyltransferase